MRWRALSQSSRQWLKQVIYAALVLVAALGIGLAFESSLGGRVTAIFLAALALIAWRWGLALSVIAGCVAGEMLNFFFLPPLHTLGIDSPQDAAVLTLFGAVSAVIVGLIVLLRQAREEANAALAKSDEDRMNKDYLVRTAYMLMNEPTIAGVIDLLLREVVAVTAVRANAAVYLAHGDQILKFVAGTAAEESPSEIVVPQGSEALTRSAVIVGDQTEASDGRQTDFLLRGIERERGVLVLPLLHGMKLIGVLRITAKRGPWVYAPQELELLESLAHLAAAAIHSKHLAAEDRMRPEPVGSAR